MSYLSAILRANPGLAVAVAMCSGFPLVLALIGLVLRASGASPRPILFLAGLMMPIALLFLVAGLVNARAPGAASEGSLSLAVVGGAFVDRARLYGEEVPADYVRDAKSVFPEFFADAEHAELAIVGTGETTLVAQFPTAETAKRAASELWRFFRVTASSGDEEHGWRGKRGLNSDYCEMLRSGRHLFLWTALSPQACAARRSASAAITEAPGLRPAAPEPLFVALQPLGALFEPAGVKILGTVLLLALYAYGFFKGAAWVGRTPPASHASTVSAEELAARLEAINSLDAPFHIERGERPGEFFAEWRYADARWLDHAGAHSLRRTFRIRMLLDEATHSVRTSDYVAEFDGSAGRDGVRLEWRAMTGIIFQQVERRRVAGPQVDAHGRPTPNASYSFEFNLGDMKSPLIEAVTSAGWSWRPTLWQGPQMLRWLTD